MEVSRKPTKPKVAEISPANKEMRARLNIPYYAAETNNGAIGFIPLFWGGMDLTAVD